MNSYINKQENRMIEMIDGKTKVETKKSKLPKMNESQLVNLIIRYYWHDPDIFLWRANAGGFKTASGGWVKGNIKGCPDIIGFIKPTGRFVGVECKVGYNKQQDSQLDFHKKCKEFGALYILAYSLEEAQEKIQLAAERSVELCPPRYADGSVSNQYEDLTMGPKYES